MKIKFLKPYSTYKVGDEFQAPCRKWAAKLITRKIAIQCVDKKPAKRRGRKPVKK
jgi:hypothetical protein